MTDDTGPIDWCAPKRSGGAGLMEGASETPEWRWTARGGESSGQIPDI